MLRQHLPVGTVIINFLALRAFEHSVDQNHLDPVLRRVAIQYTLIGL